MSPDATVGDSDRPLEERLATLFAALGIARAHVAARSSTDWEGFAAKYLDSIASLILTCPAAIDPAALRPFGGRLLVITGDNGPGSRRVQASLPDLPQAHRLVLPDYAGLTWSDLAVERGDPIGAAIEDFIAGLETLPPAPPAGAGEGEAAGISCRIRGQGPPLVLFPLELAPSQWSR